MPDVHAQARPAKRSRPGISGPTRETILNAACDAIAEVGFENIRMRIVAERAGVSTAALHYHFDTRESLFAAALRYSFDTADSADGYGRDAEETATARLAHNIDASLPTTAGLRREWALWQELWCRAGRDRESRSLAVDLYRLHTGWIQETLEAGVASGEFELCDTAEHARLINALCDGFGVQLMFKSPEVTLDGARDVIWSAATKPLGVTVPFPKDRKR